MMWMPPQWLEATVISSVYIIRSLALVVVIFHNYFREVGAIFYCVGFDGDEEGVELSRRYIFCPQYSVWRMMRNMAETCVCAALGASGIVAELCPRDSPAHKRLRAVAPFMTSLLGRALVYIIFGMICSGNYTYVSTTTHKAGPSSRLLAEIGDDTSIRVNSAYGPSRLNAVNSRLFSASGRSFVSFLGFI
ncbi:hypothetical protein FOL46_006378 [Perkinsus olseni]|uniref:Uncharacterized protein n=1 Tax=Perkinsus olseni TaxID=32597 RepID=A0A7J6MQG7_PEROL|nr:hypothetical protein FOL46_006378 [Perkinsus olseni]